ncbi:hypothetical protein [Leucobacter chromiiresistens]|uniref:Secreted protein n=1 Tax=Leucobacter chromiiresistens TaxID=1079994 RepID=A0A1H0ZW18_9MICO|nr:hypothetical protein [Leucobacter chromiiresistens]SDQ31549.1 hypothetical protein SAMN04488565_2107 [Leucobacter chromiiresistens]
MFTKSTPSRRIAALAAVMTVAGAWLLPGCSAADPETDAAASRSASETAPEGRTAEHAERAFVEWQLQYASCMREQGFDVPDPSGSSSESLSIPDDLDAYEAASERCIGDLGAPPSATGQDPKEVHERDVALVACLRENGVRVDDPAVGEPVQIPESAPGELLEKCFAEAGAA